MIYLNDIVRSAGKFFPDCYEALSVADYLKERNQITPPSLLKFLNPLMWLQGRLAYIKFSNVNLEQDPHSRFGYRIFDLTGETKVQAPYTELGRHHSIKRENLQFGRQYELEIMLWFWPDAGKVELCRVKKHGPREPEDSSELEYGLEPELQPLW